ncbi:MAG: hypothetical protein L3J76_04735 [Candidatus Hydrothermae bacterium]|nr:hypothetical protein [Candidatus Hydrothermae bacterium]
MRTHMWLLGVLWLAPLQAQVDPVVEFWYGLFWPDGRLFQYQGTHTVDVGGVPFYDGPVTYSYAIYADSTNQNRWLMDISRQDNSGFSGFNFSYTGHQAYSLPPGLDTLLPAGMYVFAFPFLDVNILDLTYDFPISTDTVPTPTPPTIYDLAAWLQQQTSLIRMQLDPLGVYDAQTADTLFPDSLRTTLWIIDEGADSTITPPLFCDAAFWPIRYHILMEDTVHMWDGTSMLVQHDRFLWMQPTCGIIKDSVFRSVIPAKRSKKAQSQTVTTSIVLSNVALLRQESLSFPNRSGNVSITLHPTHWSLRAPDGIRRVVVRDLSGRVVHRWTRVSRIPYPQTGIFVLDMETLKGARILRKVPAFSR